MNIAITGATGFIGKRVMSYLLEDKNVKKIFVLCRKDSLKKLGRYKKSYKITHIESELSLPFMGIKGNERKKLKKTTHFIHIGAIYDLTVDRETAYKVNVRGTEEALKVAEDCENLKSFTYISTVAICGDYKGIFTEDMLDEGQKFEDWYGWSKFKAEKRVREHSSSLPIKIIRPGAVIGESRTGKMDKIDGVYYAILLLSLGVHFVSPTRKDKPLPIIPVDFLSEFIYRVTLHPEMTGKTFFAIEPSSPTLDEFINIVCKELKTFHPVIKFDIKKLEQLLTIPPIKSILSTAGKLVNLPQEGINYLLSDTIYNTKNFYEALIHLKMSPSSFKNYAKNIVRYFLHHLLPHHPLYAIYKLNTTLFSSLYGK